MFIFYNNVANKIETNLETCITIDNGDRWEKINFLDNANQTLNLSKIISKTKSPGFIASRGS